MLQFNKLREKNWAFLAGFGLVCILIGIIVAASLDLSSRSSAQVGKSQVQPPYAGSASKSPFVYVAEKVSPAVVNISAKSIEEGTYHQRFYPFDDDFFRRFFGYEQQPRQKRKWESQSLGSGFLYSPEGYILTNNHVITGGGNKVADKITVTLSDGSEYKADLIGRDPETDIAILKIAAKKELPFVEFGDSDSIQVGEWAIAIGNPFPQLHLDRTLTVGVISATGRKNLQFGGEITPYIQNYIQTDAAINPGNSGGPLCSIDGKVIGINAAITTPSGGNVGIGFAIPINLARQVAPQLAKSGTVSRGYLGISPVRLTSDMAEAMKLKSTKGVLVEQVQPGTPADQAGLKTGDVILHFDGKEVNDDDQFRSLVAAASPGKRVDLEVLRNNKTQTLTVKLGERPSMLAQNQPDQPQEEESWMGLTVKTATRSLAEQYGVRYEPGAIVTDVEPGSAADEKGIQAGDLITKVDGQKVTDLDSYRQVTGRLKKSSRAVSVLVVRGEEGITRFFALKESD